MAAAPHLARGTSMRVGALHDWPELLKQCSHAARHRLLQVGVSQDDVGG